MDDDFMSDAFLVDAASTEPQTYSQRCKRTQAHAVERGKTKSRKTRELEARQEGLQRSLLDDEPSNNKGLSMLLKMGYKPGGSLGAAGSSSSTTDNNKNEPLDINMRKGRSGLGVSSPAQTSTSIPTKESLKVEATSRQDFLERSRTEYDSRKVFKTLAAARKTCEELDIRKGILVRVLSFSYLLFEYRLNSSSYFQSSFMWLDPEEVEQEEEENRRARLNADFNGNAEDDSDAEDSPLPTGNVVQDEQDVSEKEAWLALDVCSHTRTLSPLLTCFILLINK